MNAIEKLSRLFSKFPGIGSRQAKRFVYFLLSADNQYIEDLTSEILNLKKTIKSCEVCAKFFTHTKSGENLCPICSSKNRDKRLLMITSTDIDLENIEKTHLYNGLYFVMGGTVPILEKYPQKRVRIQKLSQIVKNKIKDGELEEIILGLSLNPEGENTAHFIRKNLEPILVKQNIKITTLGRGLSTGTELEYSDSDTLKYALKNRALEN